jgi:tetratricopeptide (TPR) repeat protein
MIGKKRIVRSPLALLLLLLCCTQHHEKEQAEHHYRAALALEKAKHLDSALVELRQAIALDPNFIKAHQRYAHIMRWEKKQYEEVLDEYQKKVRQHPRSEVYQYMLGYLANDPEEIKDRAEKCLKLNPKSSWGRSLLGLALMYLQDYAAAIEEFNKAIAIDSSENSAKYNLAYCYSRIDSFDRSNQIYQELLTAEKTPYHLYGYIWRNMIEKEGYTPEVKAKITGEMEALLAQKPNNLHLLQSAINTYQMLGAMTKIPALEERMMQLDSAGEFSQSIILNRLYRIQDPQERLDYSKKILLDNSNDRLKSFIYAITFRMYITTANFDTAKAIEWGEQRIKDCPDDVDAYNDLVWYLYQYRPDKLDVALEYIKKAVEIASPDQKKYVMDTMGWIYFKKGMYPEALSTLVQASELYQDPSGEVIFHLGAAQGKSGRIDEALQTLAFALSLEDIPDARKYFNEFYQAKFGQLDGAEEYLKKIILGKAIVEPPFRVPDFKLTSMDGREIGLSDFKNKVILVAFWKPT